MTAVKRIAVRAARTGVQSFIAVLTAAGTGFISVAVWKSAAVAAGAAVLSAINNALEEAANAPPALRG